MSLETEYRGYRIAYSENGDEWTCYEIGRGKGATAPTLSKMKAKVDDYLRSLRKQVSITCLELHTHFSLKAIDAVVVEYIGPTIDGGAWTSKARHVSGHKVAAMAMRDGATRVSRQEYHLTTFAPISDETYAAIAEAKRKEEILKAADRDFKAAVAAIPRLTLADIDQLVKLSGIDPTGGLGEAGK